MNIISTKLSSRIVLPLVLLGILIPEIGLFLFILIGLFLIKVHFSNQSKKYEILLGKVIEINERKSKSRDSNGYYHETTYYIPTFEYNYKEKPYRVEHNIQMNIQGKCLFKIDENVELRVNIDFPNEAVLNSHSSVNLLLYAGFSFIGIGITMMIIFSKVGLINISSIGHRLFMGIEFIYYLISKIF